MILMVASETSAVDKLNVIATHTHITLLPSSSVTVIVVWLFLPTVTLELKLLNTTVYTGIGDVPYISSSATVSCIHAWVFGFELTEKVAESDPTWLEQSHKDNSIVYTPPLQVNTTVMGTLVPPNGLTRLAHTPTTAPSVVVMGGVTMETTAST